jgi:pyruvate/2-oxoglutarate dehydrogenase complex dihydrolipoamide acyltransferase (E2) component
VFVDNCGIGLCRGAQKWKYDESTKHLAAQIHGSCPTTDPAREQSTPVDGDLCNCLDISIKDNVAQTFWCKNKAKTGGVEKNYCGDGNQEWTLESDGTFSVPTPPQSMCPAVMSCDKPASGPGCNKVCLVTAAAPSGKAPDTVDHAGSCIETSGSLGWQFVALILSGGALYACGGVAYGKRQDPNRPWSEALPHRRFWANSMGLVLDGVRFATGKSITIGGGSYEPIPRVEKAGAAPPPPPSSSLPREQPDEERWEVDGARRRNKDMKKKKSSGDDGGGKRDKPDKKKERRGSHKDKKGKPSRHAAAPAVAGGPPPPPDGSDSTAEDFATQNGEEQQRLLHERRDERLHSSQAKIKVVGING